MFYSREKDTWFICSEWSEANNSTKKPVTDLQELLDFFKNISIATKDKLFIDGKKISEEQAPHIFERTKINFLLKELLPDTHLSSRH